MHNDGTMFDIAAGAEVVDASGEKLGTVDRLEGNTIVVREGFFFPKEHVIPLSAVAHADADEVHLSVTGAEAESGQWGSATGTMASTEVDRGYVDAGTSMAGGLETDVQPFDHRQTTQATHINADDELLVPVVEEHLAATTREVERGQVRVSKDVVEEQQTLEVPVIEEEVEVTRRRVDRPVTDADHAFEDATLEVPLIGEEIEIQKRSRIVEEIDVDTTKREHVERVTDTVRREEVRVDEEGYVADVDNTRGRRPGNR